MHVHILREEQREEVGEVVHARERERCVPIVAWPIGICAGIQECGESQFVVVLARDLERGGAASAPFVARGRVDVGLVEDEELEDLLGNEGADVSASEASEDRD